MKTSHRITVAVLIGCLCAAPAPGEERGLGSRLTENDEFYALVEAEVTEVVVPGRPADGGVATIKVTRRYTGPKELIGMTFAQDTASADIWSTADLSDVLAETFKLEPDEKLRLYIAQGLAKLPRQYSTPFPPAQSDVLRELVKKETNVDVKKALQSAIDKAK